MTNETKPEHIYGPASPTGQVRLPLERSGMQTVVWHLAYATILIETDANGVTYVNGSRVEPFDETLMRHRRKDTAK